MTDNTETINTEAAPAQDTELAAIWKEIQAPAQEEAEEPSTEPTAEPAVEPVAETEPEVKPKEDKDAQKILYFKKRDKELREREQFLKQKEAQLKAEIEALQQREAKKKENVWEWLEAEGFTPEELKKVAVNGGKPVDAETRAIKERLDKFEQLEKQRQAEMEQAEVSRAAQVIVNSIQSADKYDLINSAQAYDLVIDTIIDYHNRGEPVDSWEQAADLVESELQTNVERLLQTKKGRSLLEKLLPEALPQSQKQPQAKTPVAKPTKTISQSYDAPKKDVSYPKTSQERQGLIRQILGGQIDD